MCGKPKHGDEANLSEQPVNKRSPPTAQTLPARLQGKHNSILSDIARIPTQIANSISSPTSAHSSTSRKSKQKKQWRLSNREVLFDENGGQVFVKEFVLWSPVTPTQQVHDIPHDLPIYAAHMPSPNVFQEQYHEVGDRDLRDKQAKRTDDHINPGHDALDLLARMSTTKIQSHIEKMRERRVSLCALGSKRERTVGFARPMSLPLPAGCGSTGSNPPYSSSDMVNAMAHVIPGRIHGHIEAIRTSSPKHAPFELDSTHVSPTLQSTTSTSLLQTSTPKPTTPSTPPSSYTFSDTSTYTSPTSSPSNDSQTSSSRPSGEDDYRTRTSDSWTLPPVFERLYEDAERRKKQQQQEQEYQHHCHHVYPTATPTPKACNISTTVVVLP